MPESLPRWLLGVTAIIAVVALTVGIRDYLRPSKDEKPAATASTPTVIDSAKTSRKKSSPAKTRRARNSAAEGTSPAKTQTADRQTADEMEKLLVYGDPPKANDKMTGGTDPDSPSNTVSRRQIEAAMHRNRVSCDEIDKLANLTKPGEVDAPYYENWAREYCGTY